MSTQILTVNRLLEPKNHPFRFLLYLEWILLSMTIVGEMPWERVFTFLQPLVGDSSKQLIPNSWSLTLICIVIFGLMGLRLPSYSTKIKWLYLALELGIILIAEALGGWSRFGAPYVIVLIRSCLMFSIRECIIVGGLTFFLFLFSFFFSIDIKAIQVEWLRSISLSQQQIYAWIIYSTINNAIYFGLILVFVLMLVNALIRERQSLQKLAMAHEQLRQYALRIEDQATLQERNRIAREIHDSLGHALTAQSIQLESAMLFCHSHPEKTQKYLGVAKQLAANALSEIRKSVSTLRSEPLQVKSLASLVNNFHEITNIKPDYTINLQYPLSADINIAIYRITQEALTNISKHSGATSVKILLEMQAGWLRLLIEDNGKGFNPKQNTTGFGLQGMHERASTLGGEFSIHSAPDSGCKITVDIPLPKFTVTSID